MAGVITTIPKFQFSSSTGTPLAGGSVTVYLAGTTTQTNTWQDLAQTILNTNPIILDSRGECVIFLDSAITYKFVLKNSAGVIQWTQDNISGTTRANSAQIFATLAAMKTGFNPAISNLATTLGYYAANDGGQGDYYYSSGSSVTANDFTVVQPTTLGGRFLLQSEKGSYNAEQAGAKGDGVTDDRAAIQKAIDALASVYNTGGTGGEVRLMRSKYLIKGDASGNKIGLRIPSQVTLKGVAETATQLLAGENSMVVVLMTGLNGGIENIQINNGGSFTGVTGLKLGPENDSQLITRSDVEFNTISKLSIRNLAEGIILKCGPTVSGSDSYCFYNTFIAIDIRNTTRGIWLAAPNGGTGSGCNRNFWYGVRVGENGCNTGLQIDAGNTNTFCGISFEGILTGVSPNATPTGLKTGYATVSYDGGQNTFFGLTIEACTRDIDSDSSTTMLFGYFGTGTIYSATGRYPGILMGNNSGSEPLAKATYANINVLGINKDAPSPVYHIDAVLATARGVKFSSDVGAVNNSWSVNLSAGGGPSTLFEFLSNSVPIIAWGGAATTYASKMYVSNPLNGNLIFGMNATDRTQLTVSGFMPVTDNTYKLGDSGNRWSTVYAGTGAINTSDEREKTEIQPIEDRVLSAWADVKFCQFKFKDAAEKKGSEARKHIGVIAQQVKQAFESHGLNAFEYGLLCYDEWEEEVEDVMEEIDVVLKDGSTVKNFVPTGEKRVVKKAGNAYGIRYDQALALECAYLRSLISQNLNK